MKQVEERYISFIVEMQNRWVPFFVNRFIYLSLPFHLIKLPDNPIRL